MSARTMRHAPLLLALCAVLSVAPARSAEPVKPADALAALTQDDMREDFEQAIGFIKAFAVHRDLNALRLGIDYDARDAALRSKLDARTTPCEFRDLVEKALKLVQDPHASPMDHDYLVQYGSLQSKFNFGAEEDFSGVARLEAACPRPSPKLLLPLVFEGGKYLLYADIAYRGDTIRRGTELVAYNGVPVSEYVRDNLDVVPYVRVASNGAVYQTRFYRYGDDSFVLGLSDGRSLKMRLQDDVEWTTPRQRDVSYGSQPRAKVRYFEADRILYIGLPAMDESLVDGMVKEIDAIAASGARIDKVAFDIRGNGGGSDLTWRRLLAHVLGREMSLRLDLRMKDTPQARSRYPDPNAVPEPIALLGNKPYLKHLDKVITFGPEGTTTPFKGKVFVLQDPFIYSSAANFAAFAKGDDQIVSVGQATGLVGGSQIEPLFFRLDHSGMIFRIEPVLDFGGVRSLGDFAHNSVEVEIPDTADGQFLRSTYEGDIYGDEFLEQNDPLFRYVVES